MMIFPCSNSNKYIHIRLFVNQIACHVLPCKNFMFASKGTDDDEYMFCGPLMNNFAMINEFVDFRAAEMFVTRLAIQLEHVQWGAICDVIAHVRSLVLYHLFKSFKCPVYSRFNDTVLQFFFEFFTYLLSDCLNNVFFHVCSLVSRSICNLFSRSALPDCNNFFLFNFSSRTLNFSWRISRDLLSNSVSSLSFFWNAAESFPFLILGLSLSAMMYSIARLTLSISISILRISDTF